MNGRLAWFLAQAFLSTSSFDLELEGATFKMRFYLQAIFDSIGFFRVVETVIKIMVGNAIIGQFP
jgi:hypothetical protein